ncbi:MAG: T9SS type A sorting domain-containing protein [Bacteroidia bacterium]
MPKLFSFILVCFLQISFAQRVVLLEQFTNSGCPPCAAYTPSVLNYVDTNPTDVVAIAYHTYFPYNDSMYFENPIESTSRVNYYGVASVPYSIVDGNYYSNTSSNFYPLIANTINTRKLVAKKYDINPLQTSIISNNLTTKFVFESLQNSNISDSLIAHIVVIEKNVLKSSYAGSPGANSETNYEFVMRKMLPNQSGTFLINRNLNGKDTLTFNWAMQKIKNTAEVRIVAFVQNKNTKEVYTANLFSTGLTNNIDKPTTDQIIITIYPNPTKGDVTIRSLNIKNSATIVLVDVLGRSIFEGVITPNEPLKIQTHLFDKGLHFAIIKEGNITISRKIIIE